MSKQTVRFITQPDHAQANTRGVNRDAIPVRDQQDLTQYVTDALKRGVAVEVTNKR